MCGRYASSRSAADLAALFDAEDQTQAQLRPDYNIAPTDPAPIVRRSARTGSTVLTMARWGLVPAWSADTAGAARRINARAETVMASPSFARSFAQRRCLVPADGWYEWLRPRGSAGKQAYFMTRRDSSVLALGGIWTVWGTDDVRLLTFSVLTVPAVGELALVHDRMPLVLSPAQWAPWLSASDPARLLAPPAAGYVGGIQLRPVSAAVGDVRNDGPDLVQPVSAAPLPEHAPRAESTVERPETRQRRREPEPPDTLF